MQNRPERFTGARLAVAALAIVFQATLALAAPAPALADQWSDVEVAFSLVNDARAWEGVAPLGWDGDLAYVAQAWADEMARNGQLAHNPWLADQVPGWWWTLGENVGAASSIEEVHGTFVGSWGHWFNMVNPGFTSVGVGVAHGDGAVYAVLVFAG